ncbi:zinc-ribbon domain containing protein [Zavarzinella formosa]|uniref:zinc-ribbon domain containing protein n=1 Tax=Zavarzinella formosa TaxID=360055 RepID=UPI000308BDE4|nr:zinc-ribbon domain containing protein [Zavarzinella formosa]
MSMKSGKQRRAELDAKKKANLAKLMAEQEKAVLAARELEASRGEPVNKEALVPHNSYEAPDFVKRGFYLDLPFSCVNCGKPEIWTAGQQKWWYEVAKGSVYSTANRCRACRRLKRERQTGGRERP